MNEYKNLELEEEHLIKKGHALHGATIKHYGKVEVPKTTKLTPLIKD